MINVKFQCGYEHNFAGYIFSYFSGCVSKAVKLFRAVDCSLGRTKNERVRAFKAIEYIGTHNT